MGHTDAHFGGCIPETHDCGSYHVVILGAGVSGLCMGSALRKAGIKSFLIIEKAAGIGGTWWDNSYPGAECDVRSHLYSYSFDLNPDWSQAYAPQREIQEYLVRFATKFDLCRTSD